MIKKAIIKSIIFFTIVIFIVHILDCLFIIKTDHRACLIEGLYKHSNDQYDVVLLGSSHMNGGVDPNVLWHELGITSYNYATGGQPIDVTYYLLKEVLKEHKNPIVVLDLYYLGFTDEYGQDGYIRPVIDNMNFSLNKIDAIMNCTPSSSRLSCLFPIIEYHDRWNQLTTEDFTFPSSYEYYYTTKGFDSGTNKYGKDNLSNLSTTETAEIPTKTKEYLNKFIQLSKQDGFKLVFTNMPYDYNADISNGWVKEPAKMFNTVAQICKTNNIPFINYCTEEKIKEINLNFKSDMNNSGHLNIWGADKVSINLGQFLKSKFNLKDHRNDSNYSAWNSNFYSSEAAAILYKNNTVGSSSATGISETP